MKMESIRQRFQMQSIFFALTELFSFWISTRAKVSQFLKYFKFGRSVSRHIFFEIPNIGMEFEKFCKLYANIFR